MAPEQVGLGLLVLGLVLLVGEVVRIRSRVAQELFLPMSIIAGLLALLVGPEVLGAVTTAVGGANAPLLVLAGAVASGVWWFGRRPPAGTGSTSTGRGE